MPIGHIMPVACWQTIYLYNFLGNDSSELLEIKFDDRAFHSLGSCCISSASFVQPCV